MEEHASDALSEQGLGQTICCIVFRFVLRKTFSNPFLECACVLQGQHSRPILIVHELVVMIYLDISCNMCGDESLSELLGNELQAFDPLMMKGKGEIRMLVLFSCLYCPCLSTCKRSRVNVTVNNSFARGNYMDGTHCSHHSRIFGHGCHS